MRRNSPFAAACGTGGPCTISIRRRPLPRDWHPALFEHARQRGITIFSSPFDPSAVALLESLNAPAYKIASFEIVDLPLIRCAAATGKPLIISTGMASEAEIADAVKAARSASAGGIVLLRCVSGYPAPAHDYNLAALADMTTRFGVPAGLSDHTLDDVTAIAATALGAVVIEKHFTLARADGGPDAAFSLEPEEFARLAQSVRDAHAALGQPVYGAKVSEAGNLQFRRSLYFTRDLPAGHVVGEGDVRSVRPGHGLAPKHLDAVLGRAPRPPRALRAAGVWDAFEGSADR